MSWNYRIIVSDSHGEPSYNIHEVYYDQDRPTSWTEQPVIPTGESLQDLRQDFDLIRIAFFRSPFRVVHDGEQQILVPEDTFDLSVDDYHRHEALDRAAIFTDQFQSHVASHPAVTTNDEIRSLADDIIDKLCALYQAIGRIQHNNSEQADAGNRRSAGA